jgi:putative hydrolase of the HAD superfamily
LSNTNPIHRKFGYSHYNFLNYFDKLFYSDEIKFLKPEPQIYEYVQNAIRLNPSEILFIDDVENYVNAATNCGWDGIAFKGYEYLIVELKERGIVINQTF